jgi:transketolase
MRRAFCQALVERCESHPFVFLTGDLGFMALEPLREVLKERFINAGVAEQNMVSVAAGLASGGWQTWVYSIAPFVYARPFEQIRNDVCFHKADVKLVGNGGGYGYGAMGRTHHALEDYGVLLALPDMCAYVPAFAADVAPMVARAAARTGPAYLRLGRCEKPEDYAVPAYAPWRRLLPGSGPVLLTVGPLAGTLVKELMQAEPTTRPDLWCVAELPLAISPPPDELVERVEASGRLCVVEEHVAQGGVGSMVATWALANRIRLRRFDHLHARGYPSRTFGNQAYHRRESGLTVAGIMERMRESDP